MEDINNKFDKIETVIERLGKLFLKIITTASAIIVGGFFAYTQLEDNIDKHIHPEDENFQMYLKQIETEEIYVNGDIDYDYEDSLYRHFYHLDTK